MAHVVHAVHAAWELGRWPGLIGAVLGVLVVVSQADITTPASYCTLTALSCPQVVSGTLFLQALVESAGGAIVGGALGVLLNLAITGRLGGGE
jgi:hypothetical protein